MRANQFVDCACDPVGAHALNGIPHSLLCLRQNRKRFIACALLAIESVASKARSISAANDCADTATAAMFENIRRTVIEVSASLVSTSSSPFALRFRLRTPNQNDDLRLFTRLRP